MINCRTKKLRYKNSIIILLGITILITSLSISPIKATTTDLEQNNPSTLNVPSSDNPISPQQSGDTTPPVLLDMYFSVPLALGGETITLYADVFDDLSGVQFITYYFSEPGGQTVVVGYMQYNSGSGLWEIDIDVNQYWIPGDYYISYSYFYDNANNEGEVRDGVAGWVSPRVTISGTTPDADDVIIDDVLFDVPSATTGETFWVYVQAHDDISGIKRLMCVLNRPNGDILEYGEMTYNGIQDRWEVSFTVNQYWVHGAYYIDWVYAEDNADNVNYNYNGTEFVSPTIDIYGTPLPDPDPGVLYGVFLSGNVFAPGEVVHIYVNASDAVSGIDILRIRIHTDLGDFVDAPWIPYNSGSGLWEESIVIGQYWAQQRRIFVQGNQ